MKKIDAGIVLSIIGSFLCLFFGYGYLEAGLTSSNSYSASYSYNGIILILVGFLNFAGFILVISEDVSRKKFGTKLSLFGCFLIILLNMHGLMLFFVYWNFLIIIGAILVYFSIREMYKNENGDSGDLSYQYNVKALLRVKISAFIAILNGILTLIIMFPLGITISTLGEGLYINLLFYWIMAIFAFAIILLTTSEAIIRSIAQGQETVRNRKGKEKKPIVIFIFLGFFSFIWSSSGIAKDILLGSIALYISFSTITAGIFFPNLQKIQGQEEDKTLVEDTNIHEEYKAINFEELELIIQQSTVRPPQGAITWIAKQLDTTRREVVKAIQRHYNKSYMEIRNKFLEN